MANWVKCQAYTEDRHTIWVNLDQVLMIKAHSNGSVLTCAPTDLNGGPSEYIVWDSPESIMRGRA